MISTDYFRSNSFLPGRSKQAFPSMKPPAKRHRFDSPPRGQDLAPVLLTAQRLRESRSRAAGRSEGLSGLSHIVWTTLDNILLDHIDGFKRKDRHTHHTLDQMVFHDSWQCLHCVRTGSCLVRNGTRLARTVGPGRDRTST